MRLVHITTKDVLKSIKEKGLLPTRPYLEHHFEQFGKRKVIYAMPIFNKDDSEKYWKDFIYFQVWGKPRNLYMMKNKYTKENIYSKEIPILPKVFIILSFLTNFKNVLVKGIHEQDSQMECFEDFDERFAHDDKPLYILKNKIISSKISEHGEGTPIIENNRVVDIKLKIENTRKIFLN